MIKNITICLLIILGVMLLKQLQEERTQKQLLTVAWQDAVKGKPLLVSFKGDEIPQRIHCHKQYEWIMKESFVKPSIHLEHLPKHSSTTKAK